MKNLISILILLCSAAHSQYQRQWVNVYNWQNADTSEINVETVQMPDGGIVSAGLRTTESKSSSLVRRVSPDGNELWFHHFTGTNEITAKDLIITATDKIVLTMREEDSTGTYNIRTICLQPDGTILWDKTYDTAPFIMDEPFKLASDQNGSIYVLGMTQPGIIVIHYSASGSEEWIKNFSEPSAFSDEPLSIVVENQGNGYVMGNVGNNIKIFKFTSSGDTSWSKLTNLHATDLGHDCLLNDRLGNILIYGHSPLGYSIIRYSGEGIANGRFDLSTPASEWNNMALQLIQKSDNKIVALGESWLHNELLYKIYIIQLNEDLSMDRVIEEIPDSSYIAPIYPVMSSALNNTIYYTGSYKNIFVKSVENKGNSNFVIEDTISTVDYYHINHIQVNEDNGIVLDGYFKVAPDMKMFSVMYQQDDINSLSTNDLLPGKTELYQNYPNPFNSSTVIKYKLLVPGFVSLEVYDILGHKISTLVNTHQNSGLHSVRFHSGGLSGGVYFYTLKAGNHKKSRKFLVIE